MDKKPEYTLSELMIVVSSREIRNGEVVFAGVGNPLLSALLAQRTHGPDIRIATEGGAVGPVPKRLILGIGDGACSENAFCVEPLWRLFSDQQRGFVDIGMVGGAQVDRYGNLNSTAVFGGGSYDTPASRLPGSGGANDIASSAGRTVISIPLQRRRFPEQVDYITSPGYLTGGNAREAAGLSRGGPAAVVTDKCVFRFHPSSRELMLSSLHPGVTLDEVQAEIPWNLLISDRLETTPPPKPEETAIIRTLDPEGIFTRDGLKRLTFARYIEMLERSLREAGRTVEGEKHGISNL